MVCGGRRYHAKRRLAPMHKRAAPPSPSPHHHHQHYHHHHHHRHRHGTPHHYTTPRHYGPPCFSTPHHTATTRHITPRGATPRTATSEHSTPRHATPCHHATPRPQLPAPHASHTRRHTATHDTEKSNFPGTVNLWWWWASGLRPPNRGPWKFQVFDWPKHVFDQPLTARTGHTPESQRHKIKKAHAARAMPTWSICSAALRPISS